MLGKFEPKEGRVVVIDSAGGVMPAVLAAPGGIDLMVVVVEPYPRAGEVALRLLAICPPEIPRLVVANKIAGQEDLEAVQRFLAPSGAQIDVVVPTDPSVVRADAEGVAPIDLAADSAAVEAIAKLADALRARLGEPVSRSGI